MRKSESAVAEWQEKHKYSGGWLPITGGYAPDGNVFVLLYNGDKVMPYSVRYREDKHYFVTLADAVLYIQDSGWEIPEDLRPCGK